MAIRFNLALMVLAAAVIVSACQLPSDSPSAEALFSPPPPERVAALLDFAGPVHLTRGIASADELAWTSHRTGIPLTSFSYADPQRSSDKIVVSVYRAGAFLGKNRSKFNEWCNERTSQPPSKPGDNTPATGVFRASDRRSIYQFPLGFGPGGAAYGALLPSRDSRYELVLIQTTNFHDDEDPKEFRDHVSPRKDLQSAIEAIEAVVFE